MCFGKSGHVESEKLAARPARRQPRYNNYGAAPSYIGNYNRQKVNNAAEAAANGMQAGAEFFSHGGHQHHGHSGGHHHHHHHDHHGHFDGGGHSGGWSSGGHDGGGHSSGGHDGGGGGGGGGGDGGGGGGVC